MDSDTNYNNMSHFSNKENIKTEILDILLGLYEESEIVLDSDCREFILSNVDEYLEEYGQPEKNIDTVRFEIAEGEHTEEYVKLSDISEVITTFQQSLAELLIKVVSYDLSIYLANRELDS